MATNIFVAPLPVPQYEVLDPEQCEPAVFQTKLYGAPIPPEILAQTSVGYPGQIVSNAEIFPLNGGYILTSTDQNPVLTNATEAMTGTYTVMVTDPSACADTVYATTDIVVYLSPTIDPVADIVVCHGDVVNVPAWSGNSPTATYAWTNSNTQIGLAPSGNSNIIPFFGNATVNDQIGTITVTPTNGICVGTPEVFTVL